MKRKLSSESGFTLIELLASITILSIISLSLFAFFIQASNFSTRNHDKIIAINLARTTVERVTQFEDITKSSTSMNDYASCVTYYTSLAPPMSLNQAEALCSDQYQAVINTVEYSIEVMVESSQITETIDLTPYNGSVSTLELGYPCMIRVLDSQNNILTEVGSVIHR